MAAVYCVQDYPGSLFYWLRQMVPGHSGPDALSEVETSRPHTRRYGGLVAISGLVVVKANLFWCSQLISDLISGHVCSARSKLDQVSRSVGQRVYSVLQAIEGSVYDMSPVL